MKYLIVRKEDLEVLHTYESEEKKDSSAHWNYTWAEPLAKHVECPEHVDEECAMVEMVEGEMVVSVDQVKADAKEDRELAHAWSRLRSDRDKALVATDHMMLPDYPITEAKKTEMETYRQALRDFPSSVTDPRDEYILPAKPE